MRLLHTSDWHIGVAHHGLDRTPDHDTVFGQIKALAKDEKVDVILNTGDLFDNAYPGVETLKYGWSILEELSSIAPVVVVCGNHDSHKLFELMGMILRDRLPIHLLDRKRLQMRASGVLQLPGSDGEVIKIATVPFVRNSSFLSDYLEGDPDRATMSYADKVGSIEQAVGTWLNDGYDGRRDIRVFAAHLLVDGAQVSGSEYPLYIERDFVTHPERIPTADYVAFGHIHKPQRIGTLDNARYAGSPIPIDFGERDDAKLVYIVSGTPGRPLTIDERRLDVGRPLLDVSGTLEQIAADRERYAGAIARVVVDCTEPVPQLESRVRELLPQTLICKVTAHYPRTNNGIVPGNGAGKPEPTVTEMFATYVQDRPDLGDRERIVRYFNELYEQVQHGDQHEDRLADLDEVPQ